MRDGRKSAWPILTIGEHSCSREIRFKIGRLQAPASARGGPQQQASRHEEDDEERPAPMGAILLHAPIPTNYEKVDAAYVEIVAEALSEALQNRSIQLPGEASAQQ